MQLCIFRFRAIIKFSSSFLLKSLLDHKLCRVFIMFSLIKMHFRLVAMFAFILSLSKFIFFAQCA